MTLGEYQICLNQLGAAGYTLACAKDVAEQPGLTNGVNDALALARLALHACISAVAHQAVERYGWDATVAALGDPEACLTRQEGAFWDRPRPLYEPIAGPVDWAGVRDE